jgi:hypothetical protein
MRESASAMLEVIDDAAIPAAEVIADDVVKLAKMLADVGLIGADTAWKPLWNDDLTAWGIEADHPDGPRLYGLEGADTIVCTRMRDDGRYEHAVLDEHGQPIEWRTAYRPDLN